MLACWLTAGVCHAQQAVAVAVPVRPVPQVREAARATLPVRIGPGVMPVQMRQLPPGQRDDPTVAYQIPTQLPGPGRLFRLDSEAALIQRMKQEARDRKPEEMVFPEQPVLAKEPYYGRAWPSRKMEVEPHYVCHGRLFFEEPNAERYGWDFGLFQPILSTLYFYKDTALLPMHAFTHPQRCYECSAGKCLPGDPVPYLLYPPELTVTGLAGQAAVVGGLLAVFP